MKASASAAVETTAATMKASTSSSVTAAALRED